MGKKFKTSRRKSLSYNSFDIVSTLTSLPTKILLYIGSILIIGVIVWYHFYTVDQMRRELEILKHEKLQEQVTFYKTKADEYRGKVHVLDEKKIAELVKNEMSKELQKQLKANKEKVSGVGQGTVKTDNISGQVETKATTSNEIHVDNIDLKFDGLFNQEKKAWLSKYEIKPIPLKFNWATTETQKDGIPIKSVYIEAINERTGQKLKFDTIDVALPNYIPKDAKWYEKLFGKNTLFKYKSVRVTTYGLGAFMVYKTLK